MPCVVPHIEAFVRLIENNKKSGMRVAEVGCFDGSTSKYAVAPVQEAGGKYFVVDWFKGTKIPNWQNTQATHVYKEETYVKNDFIENLKGYEDTYEIIEGTTVEGAKVIPDHSLDICFIDADHSYEAVKRDLSLYLPKVKEGGIFCGHDFDDITPDFSVARRALSATPQMLMLDNMPLGGCRNFHVGVAKAVFERFGTSINREINKNGGPPIWWIKV